MLDAVGFMLKNTVKTKDNQMAGHVERKGRRELRAGHLKEMRQRGRPRCGWIILKCTLKKDGRMTTGYIWLQQGKVAGCCELCCMDSVSSLL